MKKSLIINKSLVLQLLPPLGFICPLWLEIGYKTVYICPSFLISLFSLPFLKLWFWDICWALTSSLSDFFFFFFFVVLNFHYHFESQGALSTSLNVTFFQKHPVLKCVLFLSEDGFEFFCGCAQHMASWFLCQGLNLPPALEAQSPKHWATREGPIWGC